VLQLSGKPQASVSAVDARLTPVLCIDLRGFCWLVVPLLCIICTFVFVCVYGPGQAVLDHVQYTQASSVTTGYFPDHTLTEDYALGMEMRRTGWREVYVEDELVRGSAPDKVRGAFGQRSRWCKVIFLLCQ